MYSDKNMSAFTHRLCMHCGKLDCGAYKARQRAYVNDHARDLGEPETSAKTRLDGSQTHADSHSLFTWTRENKAKTSS